MWKDVVVVYLKVLSWHWPGGNEENHKKLYQDSQYACRDLNPGPPEYKAGMLTLNHDIWCI
jgi:hypothetical protein